MIMLDNEETAMVAQVRMHIDRQTATAGRPLNHP